MFRAFVRKLIMLTPLLDKRFMHKPGIDHTFQCAIHRYSVRADFTNRRNNLIRRLRSVAGQQNLQNRPPRPRSLHLCRIKKIVYSFF
jgi:hypothetical protein